MVAKIIHRGSSPAGMGMELFALMDFKCLIRTGVKLDDLQSCYNLPALCEGLTLRLFCELPGSPYGQYSMTAPTSGFQTIVERLLVHLSLPGGDRSQIGREIGWKSICDSHFVPAWSYRISSVLSDWRRFASIRLRKLTEWPCRVSERLVGLIRPSLS